MNFNAFARGSLDIIDNFVKIDTLQIGGVLQNFGLVYSNLTTTNNKIKKFIWTGNNNNGYYPFVDQFRYCDWVLFTEMTYCTRFCNQYYPPILYAPKLYNFREIITWTTVMAIKIFLNTTNSNAATQSSSSSSITKFYVQINSTTITNYFSVEASRFVGVLDGANTYTDKGFSYPKLSATLTLDTTNGHLIENGVDLFENYNATWYSNEDCTTTIQPTDITSNMTVYCKLTAI